MIKELVQFTEHLPEDVKKAGIAPKEGLHIVLQIINNDGIISIDSNNYQFEIYTKPKSKERTEISDFLSKCAMRSNHAWCIDTNKCFDLPIKAIHSCSPYCVAFKREHLKGGNKYINNESSNKTQLNGRFNSYFDKALFLVEDNSEQERLKVFKSIFTGGSGKSFSDILTHIECKNQDSYTVLDRKIEVLKVSLAGDADKNNKEEIKGSIKELEEQKNRYRTLNDGDYIVFYLDESLENYIEIHQQYLKDRLFNTAEYNTSPDKEGMIYGTSNFYNGFNSNMPFLKHQTATFDITSRISSKAAQELYNFEKILGRGFMPNPLPIFIYHDELENEMIAIFRKNIFQGERMPYQEIIKQLVDKHKNDFGDYYLLFHQNTKEGVIFNDFDFVSKFEYQLYDRYKDQQYWEILNLFELKEKKEGIEKSQIKHYPTSSNVFDLERQLFGSVLSNKYKKADFYFKELEAKDYDQLDFTLIAVRKYRKAIYDFIYKSKRQGINGSALKEIMLAGIRDDLKYSREYGIKDKLNIWFSLNHNFDINNHNFNNYYMPDKLGQLIRKTMEIADSKERIPIEDEYEFAFISGQLIDFLISKSQSSDKSHNLLEAFLQKSDLELFKKEIGKYFAKYKHAIDRDENQRYDRLMREVMGFDKKVNMQELITFVLAGYFSNSFYYTKKVTQESNTTAHEQSI